MDSPVTIVTMGSTIAEGYKDTPKIFPTSFSKEKENNLPCNLQK
jgi:hypothetical protein